MLTQFSPIIINTRVTLRLNTGIGNNNFSMASTINGTNQKIVLTVIAPKTRTPRKLRRNLVTKSALVRKWIHILAESARTVCEFARLPRQ